MWESSQFPARFLDCSHPVTYIQHTWPYASHIRLLPSGSLLVSCDGAANFCWSQSGRSSSQENCMADSDCGRAGAVCVCGRRRQLPLLPAVKAALIDSQRKLMNPVTSLSPDPSSAFLWVAAVNLFLSVRSLSLCRSPSLSSYGFFFSGFCL